MWVVSYFVNNGEPAIGLSPIVNIRDLSDGSLVVSSGSMVEKGDGFYAYDFTVYDDSKDYVIRTDSVTLSGIDRYSFGSSGEYNEDMNFISSTVSGIDLKVDDVDTVVQSMDLTVDSIESTVSDVDVRTTLIRKLQTNRLELEDGDPGIWRLYDDDDVTVLLTFQISDKNGGAIVQPPTSPSRRSKGV